MGDRDPSMGLSLIKSRDAREDLALKEFERSTTTSRDVAHLVSEASLLDSGNGVTTANDGARTVLGDLSEALSDLVGALSEFLELEDAHRSVPHNGLAVSKGCLDLLGGLRAVVQAHPAVRDSIRGNNLRVSVSSEFVSDNDVRREDELAVVLLGKSLSSLGGLDEVLLNKGRSGGHATSSEEGEDHATANDDLVALLDQGLKDSDLGGDLGAANNGSERLLAVGDSTVEELKLLGEQEARHGRREVLGDALG